MLFDSKTFTDEDEGLSSFGCLAPLQQVGRGCANSGRGVAEHAHDELLVQLCWQSGNVDRNAPDRRGVRSRKSISKCQQEVGGQASLFVDPFDEESNLAGPPLVEHSIDDAGNVFIGDRVNVGVSQHREG